MLLLHFLHDHLITVYNGRDKATLSYHIDAFTVFHWLFNALVIRIVDSDWFELHTEEGPTCFSILQLLVADLPQGRDNQDQVRCHSKGLSGMRN